MRQRATLPNFFEQGLTTDILVDLNGIEPSTPRI